MSGARRCFRISGEVRADVARAYAAGEAAASIAARHGIGTSTVWTICKAVGAKSLKRRERAEAEIDPAHCGNKSDAIEALLIEGLSPALIASRVGCRPEYVRVVRRRRAVPEAVALPQNSAPEAVAPILATAGRYAALADYAAEAGISMVRAQQLWHRARMGVL